MLDKYLNQTATWRQKTGVGGDAQPVRAAGVTIAVRKERCERLTRDAFGKEVLSQTTVFTKAVVSADDTIDDGAVLNVLDYVKRDGSIEGYEVLL